MALEHKHLIVHAQVESPETDVKALEEWLTTLVEKIGMKILMGPYVTYSEMPGNRGITGVVVIETSHIALHMWDEDVPAELQLDVYTCSTLDPYDVVEAIQVFEPTEVWIKYLDRENGLTEIPLLTE